MLLRELTVENFRPFERASMRLPSHGLLFVAGANNVGKSALLSSLDFVAGVSVDAQSLRHAGSTTPARVTATFELSVEERMALFEANPNGAELAARGAASRLELVFDEASGQGLALAHVLGEWPDRGVQVFATVAQVRPPGGYGLKVIRALMPNDNGDPLVQIEVDEQIWGGVVTLEHALQAGRPVPALSYVLELRRDWSSRYYHFRALRLGAERSVSLSSAPTLEPTGQNLAAVLLDLHTNRPEIFNVLRGLITEIVPDIGELRVRTSGSTMGVSFAAHGIDLNLKDLGTGVEQLLMTLVVGLTATPPFTLVIEEPETNLHHAAQRALLGLLKDWAGDRLIVAATHSPVLLDWSPGGDRLWHVTRAGQASQVTPVGDDPSELLSSLGVRLSDVLSATRVLILEGPSDQDVLNAWFPAVMRNPAVAVLSGRGGDNARHADLFAEWLAAVDRIGLRRVLYLRDRDELSLSALRKLKDSKTVALLHRRELENYLLNAPAVAEVLRALIPADRGAAPSASEIADFMMETAESLRGRVIVNRVCRQIHPARSLMDHSLRQQLANEGADVDAVMAAALGRLMTQDELIEQIKTAWRNASADVQGRSGEELLAIAPGEEILQATFMQFARRGYSKRDDGVAIAKAMPSPPDEISELLNTFMASD